MDWARSNVEVMTAIESLSRVCGEVTVAVSDEDSCSEEDNDVTKLASTLPKSNEKRSRLHDGVNQQEAGIVEELLSTEPHLSSNADMKKKIKSECASSANLKSQTPTRPEDEEVS